MITQFLTNIKLWFIFILYKFGGFYHSLSGAQKLIFFLSIAGLLIIIASIVIFIILGKKKVQYAAFKVSPANPASPEKTIFTAQIPGPSTIKPKSEEKEVLLFSSDKKTEEKKEAPITPKPAESNPTSSPAVKEPAAAAMPPAPPPAQDMEKEKNQKAQDSVKTRFINQVKTDLEAEFINLIKRCFPEKINFKEMIPVDEEVVNRCKNIIDKLDTLDQNSEFKLGPDYYKSKLIFYYIAEQDDLFEVNIKKLILLFPTNDTYLLYAASFYLYIKKSLDTAEQYCKKAKEVNSSNFDTDYLLGEIYFQKNNIYGAIELFKKILLLDPNNSTAYAYKGYFLALKGYISDGEKDLKKAMVLNDKDYHPFYFLGNIYLNLNFFSKAALYYRKAINLNCDFMEVKENLAFCFLKTKKHEMIIKLFEPLAEKKSLTNRANKLLSAGYENTGKYIKAVNCLLVPYKKIQSKENSIDLALKIADIYFHHLKNYKEAEAYYQHVLEIDKENFEVSQNLESIDYEKSKIRLHNNLGVIYAQSKNFKEAIEEFKKTLELDRTNREAIFNLDKAYDLMEAGKKTAASSPS